jgi:hypothetical protein
MHLIAMYVPSSLALLGGIALEAYCISKKQESDGRFLAIGSVFAYILFPQYRNITLYTDRK